MSRAVDLSSLAPRFLVLSHKLVEAAGQPAVYRLEIGEKTDDDVRPLRDFLFAADDPRWMKGDDRRPFAEVAREQRKIVADALGGAVVVPRRRAE